MAIATALNQVVVAIDQQYTPRAIKAIKIAMIEIQAMNLANNFKI